MSNNDFDKNKKTGGTPYIAIGVALGVVFGVVFKNIGLGLAIGVAIGAGIDFQKSKKNDN